MCVPYSFILTDKNDVIFEDDVEHHSELCHKYGLDYDSVLKPEFHIWSKELKDVEDRVPNVCEARGKFYQIGDDNQYWLRNKYYNTIQRHISNKFSTWKDGLEFVDRNWGITKKYVNKMLKTNTLLVDKWSPEYKSFVEKVCNDFDSFTRIETVMPKQGFGAYTQVNFTYYDERAKLHMTYGFQISTVELMSNRSTLEDEVKHQAKMNIAHKLAESQVVSFDGFAKAFSKKENRVECWAN